MNLFVRTAPARRSVFRPTFIGPRPHDPWRVGEPGLDEAMADPLIALVMARDGLSPAVVWPVLRAAQQRL